MKYTLTFALITLLAAITLPTTAAPLIADTERPAHSAPQNNNDPEARAQPLQDKVLETVFTAQFYRLAIRKRQTGDNTNTKEGITLAKVDQEYIYLEQPTTDQPVPDLQRLIKKSFQIKTLDDARMIETALDILYPTTSRYTYGSLRGNTIRQQGNQWFFIRDRFFSDLEGFIFKTNDDGNILSVSYSLNLPAAI